jgi:hypothetical protein
MSSTLDIQITGDGTDSGNGYDIIVPGGGTWLSVLSDLPASPDDASSYIRGKVTTITWHTFTYNNPNLSADARIVSVTAVVRAQADGGGNRNFQGRLKVAGTYYDGAATSLGNSWATVTSSVWTTNPYTLCEWNPADVNGTGAFPIQEVGFYTPSNAIQADISQVFLRVIYDMTHHTVLYPNGTGHYNAGTSWTVVGASTVQEAIDDPLGQADGDTTYTTPLGTAPVWGTWPFNAPSVPSSGATIMSVTVFWRMRNISFSRNPNIGACLRVGGTTYYTDTGQTGSNDTYVNRNFTWTTNPATSAAWTVTDINGSGGNPLQEFGLKRYDAYTDDVITQCYAIVTWYMTYPVAIDMNEAPPDITPSLAPFSHYRVPTGDWSNQLFDYTYGWPQIVAWDKVNDPPGQPNDMTQIYDRWGDPISAFAFFTFDHYNFPPNSVVSKLTLHYRIWEWRRDSIISATVTPALVVGQSPSAYSGTGNSNYMTVPTDYTYDWTTNPATGVAWTASDINGTGSNAIRAFGLYIYLPNATIYFWLSQIYIEVNCLYTITARSFTVGLHGTGCGGKSIIS